MPEPTDDELERRLRAHLAEQADAPMPDHLRQVRIGDLTAGGAPVPAAVSTNASRRWVPAAIGVAAAAAVLAVALVVGGGSDPDTVRVGTGSTTSAPSTTIAPTTTSAGGGSSTTTSAASTTSTSVTTTTAAGGQPVQADDDFASQAVGTTAPAGWEVAAGRWRVASDPGGASFHYVKSEAGAGIDSVLVRSGLTMTDGSVAARARTDGSATAGVAIRVSSVDDLRACRLDRGAGRLVLVAVQGGQSTELGATTVGTTGWADAVLTLQATGDQLSCTITGGPSVQGTDPSPRSGSAALISRGSAGLTQVAIRGTR